MRKPKSKGRAPAKQFYGVRVLFTKGRNGGWSFQCPRAKFSWWFADLKTARQCADNYCRGWGDAKSWGENDRRI